MALRSVISVVVFPFFVFANLSKAGPTPSYDTPLYDKNDCFDAFDLPSEEEMVKDTHIENFKKYWYDVFCSLDHVPQLKAITLLFLCEVAEKKIDSDCSDENRTELRQIIQAGLSFFEPLWPRALLQNLTQTKELNCLLLSLRARFGNVKIRVECRKEDVDRLLTPIGLRKMLFFLWENVRQEKFDDAYKGSNLVSLDKNQLKRRILYLWTLGGFGDSISLKVLKEDRNENFDYRSYYNALPEDRLCELLSLYRSNRHLAKVKAALKEEL